MKMKTAADLVKGWLRKADSDLTNAGLCIEQEQASSGEDGDPWTLTSWS
jgi:hypothetical protein